MVSESKAGASHPLRLWLQRQPGRAVTAVPRQGVLFSVSLCRFCASAAGNGSEKEAKLPEERLSTVLTANKRGRAAKSPRAGCDAGGERGTRPREGPGGGWGSAFRVRASSVGVSPGLWGCPGY